MKTNNNAGTGGLSKQDVETPEELISAVENFFQREIIFDLSAQQHNTKADHYYSPEDNTMTKKWSDEIETKKYQMAWVNPSFSAEQICKPNCIKEKCKKRGYHNEFYQAGTAEIVKKCHEESQMGLTICSLTLASVATKWWRGWIKEGMSFVLEKRVRFVGWKDLYPKDLAVTLWTPGASMPSHGLWDWTLWV
jgi:hypothetical protein